MFAVQYVDRMEDAEDLVQNIFIKLWNKDYLNSINTNLNSYLYQAVKNSCLNFIESNSKHEMQSIDLLHELSEELPDESVWETYIEKIYKEIDDLPPRTKQVFKAVMLENKKYKEVAENMGISVNTVKTILSRGLNTIRTNVGLKIKLSILILLLS